MKVTREEMVKGQLENSYLRFNRNLIYIALEEVEDTDFFWSPIEIQNFDEMWFDSIPLTDIAKEMRRTEMSVFLLAFDRIARGKIEPRKEWKIW